MMSTLLRTFLLILTPLTFATCVKKDKEFVGIPDGLRKQFNFQPGSYWIFKDSATQQIDSFFVVSNKHFVTNGSFQDREAFTVTIAQHQIFPMVDDDTTIWSIHVDGLGFGFRYHRLPDRAYDLWLGLFNYPLSSSGLEFLSQVIIEGKTYNNVYIVRSSPIYKPSAPSSFYKDAYFLSGNCWFIKMIFDHPTENVSRNWNLLTSKVITE